MFDHNNVNIKDKTSLTFVVLLSFLWGGVWAAFLQFSRPGRWLAVQRTYITVIIGVGINICLAALVVPMKYVMRVLAIFSASSILIIARSLINERAETDEYSRVAGGEG